MQPFHTTVLLALGLFLASSSSAKEPLKDPSKTNYDQWKLALSKDGVTNPVQIELPQNYEIEIVRVAEPHEGSWINLAFDPKGRLIVSREDKGLLRFMLADDHKSVAQVETVEDTLLECRGLLFAHESLYVAANNSKGVYRLKDTDGDDTFDDVKLLKTLDGGVGHGRNCLALGPDGKIYLACGNNVQVPKDISPKSPYRNYGLDRLLPSVWNEFLFDADVKPPAGFVIRTDADGKDWELFAGGFRNEYGLAFNPDGELFTYDADMEWDEGAPWYRPTCVMHVVSGGEYGWRQGTSVWPDFFADSLPRVVDVGLGSPTAIAFGTHSHFPRKYRDALFILDWAYGRILAVHLTPDGASYKGEVEPFLQGKPLNVTGITFGPDGCMYFTVGGRRTQSALYRVRYVGEPDTSIPQPEQQLTKDRRALRKLLESAPDEYVEQVELMDAATKALGHEDQWIRFAARTVIKNGQFAMTYALHALRRINGFSRDVMVDLQVVELDVKSGHMQPDPFESLMRLSMESTRSFSRSQRITLWRAIQLATIRSGRQSEKTFQELWKDYPADSFAENALLCELLVFFHDEHVIEETLKLHAAAPNQQEKLFYLFTLRHMRDGWTLDQRRGFLRGLKEAEEFDGAQYMQRFVAFIRTDFLNTFREEELAALAQEIATLGQSPSGEITSTPRPVVKAWTMEELTPLLDQVSERRNRKRGGELFAEALCVQCHRREGLGRAIGPDLNSAANKFSRQDLLETIIAPSKIVEEKYRLQMIETDDGQLVIGELVGGDADTLSLAPSPLSPTRMHRIRRDQIVSRTSSPTSIMPEGLLNTLTQDEILDLLAFLEYGTEEKTPAEPR